MRIGTLFSGIGAPEQGAKKVYEDALKMVFACEWDKFARQSFLANYDIEEAHFHKDIYDMDGTAYEGKVDILIGGSPCQAFSIAGIRKGLADKRGELIYEYIRIVNEVKAPIIIYENVKGFLSIKTLQYPHILNEELLWQEVNLNISSSSKITLGKYLLQRCAEYLVLKNIKSDISHIKKLALTSEKWENVVLIGAMKKLQSYLTQIKQIMKKQNLFQTEQTLLLECKEEDLDLILNLLNTMNHLSIKDINLSEEKKDTLEVKEDTRESIDLLLSNISEDLLKKAKLSITLMEENWTIELKTYAYAMGKLNTLISIINLWKSSQSLWTEILSISISQISNIKSNSVFDEFVQSLRDIGYHCHYGVLNSKDYGVPQNRERLFLVGFLEVEHYHAFSFAPKIKLEKRLRDVLESEVDEKYYLSHKMIEYISTKAHLHQSSNQMQNGDECRTLNATDYKCPPCVGVVGMLDIKGNESIRRVYGVDGNAPCLQTMQGGMREPKIIEPMIYDDYNGKLKTDGIACTLTINCGAAAERNGQKVIEPSNENEYRIRKLTPRECLRLQDFPDTFKQVVSDSQMYKQAGNSMTVAVLEMIFRQIEKAKRKEITTLF